MSWPNLWPGRYIRQRPTYPPVPVGMAFVDRVTGQRWLLTSSDSKLALEELDDPWPGYDFAAYSEVDFPGPFGPIRLSVEGGKLVARELEDTPARSFPPVLTRPRAASAGKIYQILAFLRDAPDDLPGGALLLEGGDYLLTEAGDRILVDG